MGRREGRLQDVRGALVLARGAELATGRDAQVAATVAVEQATEDGGRVEAPRAVPVDRPIAGDERGRMAVADERVIGDGRIAPARTRGPMHLAAPAPWPGGPRRLAARQGGPAGTPRRQLVGCAAVVLAGEQPRVRGLVAVGHRGRGEAP